MSHPVIPTITVGELLDRLSAYPRETDFSFSGLTFSDIKWRGPARLNLEFRELVYRNTKGVLVAQDHAADD